ncbi:MAG: heavy metal translocating P-type ATPase [Capsulimonas sp.]|uniref:heavy metal translocating P-type ATPase n=1 Tax=Capsulimonas sp. TaxID=2494211 RepID=UPI00326732F1
MKQSRYYIDNLCCPTEEQIIRNRLTPMKGVEQLKFNLIERELTVSHTIDDEQSIVTALNAIGMGATPRAEGVSHTHPEANPSEGRERLLLGLSGLLALGAEAMVWAGNAERSPWVIGVAVLSLLLGGRETLRKGWASVRTFTLNINFLMTVAILGAMAIGQWPEAAMVTFLFALAERIEAQSLDRARGAIRSLMELAPETVTIQDEAGRWSEVEASLARVGQLARVRPGERIPLDGDVTEGYSSVNQAPITGESVPVEKRVGDGVFAGSVNERGSFVFRITANRGNTTLDRIVRAVQEAQGERAPTQSYVERFARFYTPGVVVLALLVAIAPTLIWHASFSVWLYRALVLLVIACPCALVISTPVTIVSGLAAAAKQGVLIKGGAYLEQGRLLRAVALDKTGTLTHGKPTVTDVSPLNGADPKAALHLAASLDSHSEHPIAAAIAAAIVAFWTSSNNTPTQELLAVTEFEALPGRGVRGDIQGKTYYLGNQRLAEANGVRDPFVMEALERMERDGKTAVALFVDGKALAVFGVADTLRDTSAEAVRQLRSLGVTTILLTGDNQTTAAAIARAVGITDARGGMLPEDKQSAIRELIQKYGSVGMVGDGINDAPALAQATIGMAMGAAGTDTALETADVALMRDDLRKLPFFLRLSRQTHAILVQNIAIALGIKIIFLTLAMFGEATLWMAVFADMGGSLLVVMNGLRLVRFRDRDQNKIRMGV